MRIELVRMFCVTLTYRGQVTVLTIQKEQIDGNLLARALECVSFVEIGGRSQVVHIFGRPFIGILTRLQTARIHIWQTCLEHSHSAASLLLQNEKQKID